MAFVFVGVTTNFENMKVIRIVFALLLSASSLCAKDLLHQGHWRGLLQLNDSTELPFNFQILRFFDTDKYFLAVHNGRESIQIDDFRFNQDSVWWTMPVYNTRFSCRRESDTIISGEWSNTAAGRPYVLKFRGIYGQPRYPEVLCGKQCDFSGKWECTFSPGKKDESKAIGLFRMDGIERYYGTFATEYGDYRYLAGAYTSCCEMSLSCFDGQFAYLFKAKLVGDTIVGESWAGKYYYQPWTAKRNDNFELRDPDHLTFAKDSTDVDFTFNDLNGKPVSLSDYRGKVVIVQIMGTWCPNCLDETGWMQDVYKKYNSQGLEIIGLAYERKGDTASQNAAIRRIRDRYHVTYTLLNTGKSGKDSASASLPFLNGIFAFPTSIYIDRNGNVRRIHSGYNGPATGSYYTRDSEDALRLIQQLLAEKPKK